MSRVLLIGRGPLPTDDAQLTGFSQLRTAHFLRELQTAGHSVRTALLVASPKSAGLTEWAGLAEVEEEGPGWLKDLTELAEEAEIIISAGPYNPGRAACLIAEDRPVWADLPGDPFAELHALASGTEHPLSPERLAAAEAAALPVLARADGISVISEPQRHALSGQLGTLGRLLPGALPVVATIPIAMPPGPTLTPSERQAGEPLVVALSGAFNPWFDDRTAAEALDQAMRARPQLSVLVTGGGLPGFFEEGAQRFSRWAQNWPDRVSNHGWLPLGEVSSVLQQAHIGLSLDLPGPEPELGSRTRLLSFIQHGLLPVATARCALAKEMHQHGELIAIQTGQHRQLAQVLIDQVDTPSAATRISQAQVRLGQRYDGSMPELIAWSRAPIRVRSAPLPAALLASELAGKRDALAQIHASPTWRALSWLGRLVQRD
jgi:hypothetical protein